MAFRSGTKTERDVPDMQKQTEDYALRVEYERIRVDQLADEIASVKRKIIAERDHRAEWGGPGAMEGQSDSVCARPGLPFTSRSLLRPPHTCVCDGAAAEGARRFREDAADAAATAGTEQEAAAVRRAQRTSCGSTGHQKEGTPVKPAMWWQAHVG